MSDIDMDTSPKSNSSSGSEKPPTPGYENEDGDEQDDDFDPEELVTKNEKADSVHSKSPRDSIHDESDDDAGDGSASHQGSLSDDHEVEETTAVPPELSGKGSSIPSSKDEIAKIAKSKEGKNTAKNELKPDRSNSSVDHKTNETVEDNLLSEVTNKKDPELDNVKGQEFLNKSLDGKEPLPKVGGGHVDDGDLLQISDLSVDLTGDEAAIVEDILQSAGDGELIPSATTAEEKPSKEGKPGN